MERTLIINAPFTFRVVWSFLRPLLDKRVTDAISILGDRAAYLPVVSEYLDEADLPTFLGGTDGTLDFVNEVGPWAEYLPDLRRPADASTLS